MVGACFLVDNNNLNNDLRQSMATLYLPLGVFGEIQLGSGWALSPSLFYNFVIVGGCDHEYSHADNNSSSHNYSVSHNLRKTKGGNVKVTLSRKVSDRVTFQLEPFCAYWGAGTMKSSDTYHHKKSGVEKMTSTIKFQACELGLTFGMKF